MMAREPLLGEEKAYRAAISARDEELFLQLFDLYPGVLWGSITNTLSAEDRKWTAEVAEKASRRALLDDD